MKWIVTVLTVLGGLLPAASIYGVWRAFGARRAELQGKLDQVDQIVLDPALTEDEKNARLTQEFPPDGTWTDVMYTRERLQLELLKQTVPDVSMPAVLAGLGVFCATAAGVLSAWYDI